jgi:hypothetical protein
MKKKYKNIDLAPEEYQEVYTAIFKAKEKRAKQKLSRFEKNFFALKYHLWITAFIEDRKRRHSDFIKWISKEV